VPAVAQERVHTEGAGTRQTDPPRGWVAARVSGLRSARRERAGAGAPRTCDGRLWSGIARADRAPAERGRC
jgi:hypothetical protein